jgi:hypothetical protein
MATAKRAPKAAAPADENEDFQDYIDFQSLNPALEQIRADLNITGDADVTCHVSKLDADGKGTEFKVWTGDPDEYNLEAIAKRFGSGQYRIMVYMKIPSGHKVRQINKVQALMLSPEDEARVIAARAAAANPPEVKQSDNGINSLAGVMVQGFQQLGELIAKTNAAPQVDPLQQMQALAGIMRTMMPAAAPPPAGPGFMEMLNMVKTFNDVAGVGKASLPADADSSTALMMAGMDMFKPVIAKAMEQKANAPALAAPVPTSGDQSASRLTEAQPIETDNEEFMLFKLQLKAANKAAAHGADAADFADTIFAILPDAVLQGMAFDPAWFEYLVKAVPDCGAHKAWYEQVRAALVEIGVEDGVFIRGADGALTLPPEPAQNAENPAGTPADAAGTKPAAP